MLCQSKPVFDSAAVPFRAPRRISITIPYAVYTHLLSISDEQGRSLSNYAAHLLELSMLQRSSADIQPR